MSQLGRATFLRIAQRNGAHNVKAQYNDAIIGNFDALYIHTIIKSDSETKIPNPPDPVSLSLFAPMISCRVHV